MKTLVVVVGSCALTCAAVVTAGGDTVPGWADLARARGWVTGGLTSSKPALISSPADQLLLRIGGDARVAYELRDDDVSLSEPVLSRNGAMLAFAKIEARAGRMHRLLYVMPLGGVTVRRVAELEPPSIAPRAVHDRLRNLAWSHDNTVLAYWGRTAEDGREGDPPLRIIDARAGDAMVIGRVAVRPLGQGYLGPVLTDQAWAPDNRRLVLMKASGDLAILDVVTRTETLIGAGAAATWSPDGEWIAARVRLTNDPFGDADYVVIAAAPPHARTTLASYRAPRRAADAPFTGAVWYVGAALWSPDNRFLVVRRVVGEHEELYAIDRTTGATKKLPRAFWETRSLGGRP